MKTTILRQRMTEDMQVRNLSRQTQASYVLQVSQFARYFNKSPAVLGPEEIRSYQVYLTNQKKLEASSIKVAVAALVWGDFCQGCCELHLLVRSGLRHLLVPT